MNESECWGSSIVSVNPKIKNSPSFTSVLYYTKDGNMSSGRLNQIRQRLQMLFDELDNDDDFDLTPCPTNLEYFSIKEMVFGESSLINIFCMK